MSILMGGSPVNSYQALTVNDDGYVNRTTQTTDGYTHKLCGLAQVDSVVESGTGVLTLTLKGLDYQVLGLTVIGVDPAATNLTATLISVVKTGTTKAGNPAIAIALQVWQAGSKGALTANQGLCIRLVYSRSNLLGAGTSSSPQAGMV